MLVYITNRKLNNVPKTLPVFNYLKDIGVKLNNKKTSQGDAIYCGISNGNYSRIKFFPRTNEEALFDEIKKRDKAAYNKPWVVLLHGYHQDVKETIVKARFLIENHNVNVVLFSWPSRPNPVNSFNSDTFSDYIRDFLKSMIFGSIRSSLTKSFLKDIKNLLKDFVSNYKPARKNAEASTTDFYNALVMLDKHLTPRVRNRKVSLIVHSLGNYLLRKTIVDKRYLPITFKNIILHEADVDASDHRFWIPKLTSSISSKLYITVNVYDYVLAASNVLHRSKLRRKDVERLGQSVRVKPDGVYQGYIHDDVEYLDLTDGYGVDAKHEIFTCTGVDINDEPIISDNNDIDDSIFKLIGKIIKSTGSDGLPTIKGRSSNGMSKMITLPNIYKPRLIVLDEDLCDGVDEVCFIESINDYTDPFKPETFFDSEFDD